jgi:hypothetical protein
MRWSFEIVPVGGHQRLAVGSFDAPRFKCRQRSMPKGLMIPMCRQVPSWTCV